MAEYLGHHRCLLRDGEIAGSGRHDENGAGLRQRLGCSRALGLVALYTFPAAIGLTAFARAFNLISLGEETAAFLGARVERVKVLSYVVASLLVAASVAVCGVIGFIGLVVPHALRMMWGSDHRLLLPGSFLAGGAFLLLTDTAARTLAAPAELPVGVITALVGVPFFVVLLRRTAA
jgi:iron complex transport system permease protein